MSARRLEITESDDGYHISQYHGTCLVGRPPSSQAGSICNVLIDVGYRLKRWEDNVVEMKKLRAPTPESMLLEALKAIANDSDTWGRHEHVARDALAKHAEMTGTGD